MPLPHRRSIASRPLARPVHQRVPSNHILAPTKSGHVFHIGRLGWDDDVGALIRRVPAIVPTLFLLTDAHAAGAWSDTDGTPSERERNLHALHHCLTIRSCYFVDDDLCVYIRTDAQRLSTLVSLREL